MSPFEIGMLVCFGISWPMPLYLNLKQKAAGKSIFVYDRISSAAFCWPA